MIIYKRFFDIIIVLIFSPIILFLFFLVSIYLLIAISSPIFFVQMRAGKHGKPFKLYKFRTMAITMNQSNNNFEDERKRVLKSTYFLRLLKLDEIPQFLNILKGDLTLVGPRPLLLEYNELYSKQQKKRLTVLPGLTGWAQINGSNNISWKKKFELDIYYVENLNVLLDIKIIFMTLVYIFKKIINGSNVKEKIIGEKFNGKN
jgi:sugar transferase EpsL